MHINSNQYGAMVYDARTAGTREEVGLTPPQSVRGFQLLVVLRNKTNQSYLHKIRLREMDLYR